MMKMLKKINMLSLVILTFIFCIVSVNAAGERLQVVTANGATIRFQDEGGTITKTIIAANEVKGEITIEVKIANAKETEMLFLVDNSTELDSIVGLKQEINTAAKTLVGSVHDNLSNIKTGLLVFHPYGTTTSPAVNGGMISALSIEKDATLAGFDTLSALSPIENGQDFIEVLNKAKDSFSATAENKIVVLVISGLDQANIETYKEAFTQIGSDVQFITVVIDNDDPHMTQMFGSELEPTSGILHNSEDITSTLTQDVRDDLINKLPQNKYDVVFEDLFPDVIMNNFKISYVGNPSQGAVGEFNASEKKLTWTVGDLVGNKNAVFQYKLSLNASVPASELDKMINTNDKIYISYLNDFGTTNETKIYECSPIIKLLISNPKTGIYDYFIPAALIFCVSVLVISIIKRKDVFVQI